MSSSREIIMLSLLAVAVLLLGLWPDPLAAVMHATVDNLLQHIDRDQAVTALVAEKNRRIGKPHELRRP